MTSPENWTSREVASELNRAGLGMYSATFLSNKINGENLFSVDDARLRSMGVSATHRAEFSRWVKALRKPHSNLRSSVPMTLQFNPKDTAQRLFAIASDSPVPGSIWL
jgi:hypothetical protein